jgi:hypothetical protein
LKLRYQAFVHRYRGFLYIFAKNIKEIQKKQSLWDAEIKKLRKGKYSRLLLVRAALQDLRRKLRLRPELEQIRRKANSCWFTISGFWFKFISLYMLI